MAKTVHLFVLAGVLVIVAMMIGGAEPMEVCNVNTDQLSQCQQAVTAPVQPPTTGCCDVIRQADIQCLCGYKSFLPEFGYDADLVMQLPEKCGVTQGPACTSP